ncbi:MAG: [Ni/Fe] hydrogenase, large subunit MSMEG_2719 [uncultured Rubrobacteraceae bacterium]|uniref:[Ni/Fe] hydrogenase, large subunit MSMEG_2719 n=1 Tax=uncultured Rubrobacteraceae bacterium TaxID=349277 RepID=A0A6J4NZW5_9ACTN|nr:MAG: [Ni/Fe] hydrogenase, large subunit MSMEG_2719 [uncultured Rubrobacteraceae bacterium]
MAIREEIPAESRNLTEMSWDPITRIVGNLGIYTKIDFDNREVVEPWVEAAEKAGEG